MQPHQENTVTRSNACVAGSNLDRLSTCFSTPDARLLDKQHRVRLLCHPHDQCSSGSMCWPFCAARQRSAHWKQSGRASKLLPEHPAQQTKRRPQWQCCQSWTDETPPASPHARQQTQQIPHDAWLASGCGCSLAVSESSDAALPVGRPLNMRQEAGRPTLLCRHDAGASREALNCDGLLLYRQHLYNIKQCIAGWSALASQSTCGASHRRGCGGAASAGCASCTPASDERTTC